MGIKIHATNTIFWLLPVCFGRSFMPTKPTDVALLSMNWQHLWD